MDFIRYIKFIFIFSIIITSKSYAQNFLSYEKRKNLPELSTKQSIDNLRFISFDGKFTYYQKRTGVLNLSTNYKVTPVLTSPKGTHFNIYSSETKKHVVISEDQTYHSFYGIRKSTNIHISKYGKPEIKKIGKGVSPKLHLKDNWVSFYNPQLKTLHFTNINFSSFSFKIKLIAGKNPYFIPMALMITEGDIYYTDMTLKGHPVIINFNRKKNIYKRVYEASSHQFKLEICLNRSQLIMGEFNLYNDDSLNIISSMDKNLIDFSKRNILYESPRKDFGNMICNLYDNEIFFIKNFSKVEETKKTKMEVARLTLNTKKIKLMSNINFATQIINMDGRLLLPYRGKFYLLIGDNNLDQIDMLGSPKKDSK